MIGDFAVAKKGGLAWLNGVVGIGALGFALVATEICADEGGGISEGERGIGLKGPHERFGERGVRELRNQRNASSPNIVLPPVGAPLGDDESLARSPRVYVNSYSFVGNTVFSNETLFGAVSHYSGRYVHAEELQEVRHILSQFYIDRGYVISGAFIPDQEIEAGVVKVQVVEGRLSALEVEGNRRLRPSYLRNRITLDNQGVLNVSALRDSLYRLKLDSRVEDMQVELLPGEVPGEGVLRVEVEEARNYHLAISANNHRSTSVGENRVEIDVGHHNVSGFGDEFGVRYGVTEGLADVYVTYAAPVNPRNTKVGIGYGKSDSLVVERPFDELDIESELESGELYITHPISRAIGDDFELTLRAERRGSETSLLGVPFSFSPGVDEGRSAVAVMRVSLDRLKRRPRNILAMRSQLSLGVDAFGATISDSGPDGQFLSWLGQFQWVQRFRWAKSLAVFRFDTQLSEDALLPMEKFSVGGANSVRGYPENWLVRDNGWVASIEQRFPLTFNARDRRSNALEMALFVDAGRGWNRWDEVSAPETLSSVGFGIRYELSRVLRSSVYWGQALTTTESGNGDLQSQGIHFQINLMLI